MIRPVTIVTFLMACGSGLYLYQSKHEVQLLDKTIERTLRETSSLREQSRLLSTEWTMLSDPERLRQFSDTYLGLKPIAPSQFSSLADLDSRLPAVRVEPVAVPVADAPEAPESVPVAPAPVAARESVPVPPRAAVAAAPVPRPAVAPVVVASLPRPLVAKVKAPRPAVAEAPTQRVMASADTRAFDQRMTEQRASHAADVRPGEAKPYELHPASAQPRPAQPPVQVAVSRPPLQVVQPLQAQARPLSPPPQSLQAQLPRPVQANATVASAMPFSGSLLGAARGSMPASPRPMPINTTQFYNTN